MRKLFAPTVLGAILVCTPVFGTVTHKPAPKKPHTVQSIAMVIGVPIPASQLQISYIDIRLHAGSKPANITNAKITVALSMPGMSMPANIVHCTLVAPGYYQAIGTFTMSGDWKITANATMPGGKHLEAQRIVSIQ